MSDFVSGRPLGNAFEPVLRRLQPAVDAALIALSRFGAACVTGSGSGCFLRFDTRDAAEDARRRLPDGLRAWTSAGAARSPLLDALGRWRDDGRAAG
jgi:4-diphosphocytidyl-2-C-methyl-D-erythritol kinase